MEAVPIWITERSPASTPKCRNPATYKIAAPWSDGCCEELTTYGLACRDHFAIAYREASVRKVKFPPTSTERVGEVGIYRCQPDRPSKEPYASSASRRLAGPGTSPSRRVCKPVSAPDPSGQGGARPNRGNARRSLHGVRSTRRHGSGRKGSGASIGDA